MIDVAGTFVGTSNGPTGMIGTLKASVIATLTIVPAGRVIEDPIGTVRFWLRVIGPPERTPVGSVTPLRL
jgi:hypothetical protein